MSNFELLPLGSVIDSFQRRPGLIFGPEVTAIAETARRVISNAFSGHSEYLDADDRNYRSILDQIAQSDSVLASQITQRYRDGLNTISPSLDLPHLAAAGWSVCISLTEDLLFESALRTHLDSRPTSTSATIIDSIENVPPDRTIPIYKLLGNFHTKDDLRRIALSESELLIRQQSWPAMLRTVPDYLKDSALFILGTSNVSSILRSVLGTLLAMPRPNVGRLLFLKDDPILHDPTIRALASQRSVQIVDASLRQICAEISNLKARTRSPVISSTIDEGLGKLISKFDGVVSIVPVGSIDSSTISKELPKLVDGLFRPASIDWRPFLAKLDLRRTVTEEILTWVREQFEAPAGKPQVLVVHGEAGIGKTLLLKRAAVEIASADTTVLWSRRFLGGGSLKAYRELARDLSDYVKENPKGNSKFVLFCDDPWALRIDATDLVSCFDHFPAKVCLVIALRNSDYFASELLHTSVNKFGDIEVPYAIDDQEIDGLKEMLVKVAAVKDKDESAHEIAKLSNRSARDILCSLWYLVPETKSQIIDSLRDEYCRLGEMSETVTTLAGSLSSSTIAHKAYEYVTVMSNLGLGLPIEVLVRALKVSYDDWLDMTVNGRPLWGLLYDETDDERGTVQFRTRNEIVTSVLLDLVNGGVGHAGEIRVLKELLSACNVGSPIYREFVLDVLVRAKTKLAKILSYQQGLELFEIARSALPYSDRVLEHHKGIWMHSNGHDFKNAYSQFEVALACDQYPGTERDAAPEHIHTSMAAALVQLIKIGSQERNTGHELVRQHLKRASSPSFFNLHTSHVAANLYFELSLQDGFISDELGLASLAEAMNEIERAKQMIGVQPKGYSKYEKSLGMMADLLRRIIDSIPDVEVIKKIARDRFEDSGNQIGFDVAARRLLVEASEGNKGKLYREVQIYLDQCIELIQSKGHDTSPELMSVKIDLMIRWRIQRQESLDWLEFRSDLEAVLRDSGHRDNVIKQFYYAVALFQTGEFTDANARFAGLRRLQSTAAVSFREVRCYYLGAEGSIRRFQGKIEKQTYNWYFYVDELDITVPARSPSGAGGNGAIAHGYIGFALNGPIVTFVKPGEQDVFLS